MTQHFTTSTSQNRKAKKPMVIYKANGPTSMALVSEFPIGHPGLYVDEPNSAFRRHDEPRGFRQLGRDPPV